MADTLSRVRRSWLMGRVGPKNTTPEMAVRKAVHRLGYRFRLHRKDLPGQPDLVFPRLRKAIFVHGCFWHRHDCKKATFPKSNVEYWSKKFHENVDRDTKALEKLKALGWSATVIWECQTINSDELSERLVGILRETP
jgi:DNA mismatch endonuclease, patch repair protein